MAFVTPRQLLAGIFAILAFSAFAGKAAEHVYLGFALGCLLSAGPDGLGADWRPLWWVAVFFVGLALLLFWQWPA